MSAIAIEATLKGTIRYEMPEFVCEAMKRAFDMRLNKTISGFVRGLPPELKALVTVGELTPYPKPVPQPSWVFFDELATPEEIQRAAEHWKNQIDKVTP